MHSILMPVSACVRRVTTSQLRFVTTFAQNGTTKLSEPEQLSQNGAVMRPDAQDRYGVGLSQSAMSQKFVSFTMSQISFSST